jgi:hypothetical protein
MLHAELAGQVNDDELHALRPKAGGMADAATWRHTITNMTSRRLQLLAVLKDIQVFIHVYIHYPDED